MSRRHGTPRKQWADFVSVHRRGTRKKEDNMLTNAQRSAFFVLLSRAALEQGRTDDKDGYRHEVMLETIGVEHLSEVGRTGDFDKLMTRLAEDAHDYILAAEYAGGDIRRLRKLLLDNASDVVSRREVAETPERYIAGIMFQGRLVYRPYDTVETFAGKLERDRDATCAWSEIPADTLRLVLKITASDKRRLAAGKGAS